MKDFHNISNTELTSLFLQSALKDSENDYIHSIVEKDFPHWDAIILTASNDAQAEEYQMQIDIRRNNNQLPLGTDFVVVPDEGNQRVGSAGSTLSVLKVLYEKYGALEGRRYLCIHAGGNSSRCPQYSALGKLFAPLPVAVNGKSATLFDMFLITMASMPSRIKDGMLLLSGDVTLLFNPLQCDFGSSDAAVISFKENVETGKDHGVYVKNPATGNVRKFLHKQTVEKLQAEGAVDERGMCSIDTGAIWLSPVILNRLFGMIDTPDKYSSVVNSKVRLSLYSDIAYCLAEDANLEKFQMETPEGDFCQELTKVREDLWNAIGSYNMKLMNLAPAKFVHFGSIPEIMELMNNGVEAYSNLGWAKQINSSINSQNISAYNSVLSDKSTIGENCYLEVSYVHSGSTVGHNSYLSYIDIHEGQRIPDNVLVHGLKQKNGKFVCRIMGITDNPKKDLLFGINLKEISSVLDSKFDAALWDAEIYPECDTVTEAVDAAINLYNIIVNNNGDIESWKNAGKKSLCSGFNEADSRALIDWNSRMEELVKMDEVKNMITSKTPAKYAGSVIGSKSLSKVQNEWLNKEISTLDLSDLNDLSYAIRLYYYFGVGLNDSSLIRKCFSTISNTILDATLNELKYNDSIKIVEDETIVKLPLRVNWGGGWSDTPVHCLEKGGTVLNAAIKLAGEYPVEARLVKIPQLKVVFDSRDMDVHGEFDTIAPLQETGNPFDPFALQKACLLACGIIPKEGGDLKEILTRLGGGFELHSEVTNVPKGSGLGTSSILSAATVKATLTFMGIPFTDDTLYSVVLAMEQIMSTGGGWQDQVGGVTPGVKFITSSPGINQKIKVDKVVVPESARNELNERFCLISSGQRRLARNLLRDVVGRYVGNEPESITAHKMIQESAALMRFALEKGDIDEFAHLLNEHWSLSQMIDAGSTNSLIDNIFLSIDDLIDAKMVCGAGGGGFLQVILKKGVSKDDVHNRLKSIFLDFSVDVWDSEIVFD